MEEPTVPPRRMTGIDASRLNIGNLETAESRDIGPVGDIGDGLRTMLLLRLRLIMVDGDFNLLLIVSNLLFPDRLKNPVFELGRDGESSNGPNKPPDSVLYVIVKETE